ncbi:MAG: NAD(P)/FAD-dependent oxidoreductase, partial [Promethearchaeota archaeon]
MVRFVIVGSGAAGLSAAQAIRENNLDADVVVVSRDTKFYSLFALPFYIAGEIDGTSLDRFSPQFFQDIGVELRLGTTATEVKPESNSLVLADGTALSYDALLVATGSSPVLPPIPGLDKEGVVTLASLKDSEAILARSKQIKAAAVIGAGFVGTECAIALHTLGVQVTIIEREDCVLPRMLDEDTAEIVMQLLRSNHVDVRTSSTVDAITGDQKVEGVQVGENQIPCDLVVAAAGVRPNLSLLKGTKVKTNIGVLVDKYMRTSVSNIYAAGDVAEALDRATNTPKVNAIWPNAIAQGRIAGQNMLGLQKPYDGSDTMNLINIFDTPVLSIGLTSAEAGSCETFQVRRGKVFRKLLLRDGRVLGYQSVGDLRNAGFILHAHRTGTDIGEWLDALRKDKLLSHLMWQSLLKR